MSRYSQGANDIRWLAARFRGLIEAAEALEKVGSLEDAMGSHQRELDRLGGEIEKARVTAEKTLADAREAAQRIRDGADAQANLKRDEMAKELIDAQADAKLIRDKATDDAERIINTARELAKEHDDKKAMITQYDEEIAKRREQLQGVQAEIIKEQGKLGDARHELHTLKMKIHAMLTPQEEST